MAQVGTSQPRQEGIVGSGIIDLTCDWGWELDGSCGELAERWKHWGGEGQKARMSGFGQSPLWLSYGGLVTCKKLSDQGHKV
jgi:hypothetical protein